MKHILLIVFALPLLFSCQNSNNSYMKAGSLVKPVYLDQQFINSTSLRVETEEEVFMLDDEMIQMVENFLNINKNDQIKAKQLLKQIFSSEKISLSYSSNANLTAREAFHSQKANCMSLTIMAYALAKRAKLNINFQQVDVPEYWVRNGQYNLLTGHINLLVNPRNPRKYIVYGNDSIQIDFDPYAIKQSFPRKVISKKTVLAMFYNNKGGQAIVEGKYNIAYQYLKAATSTDTMLSSAWGNLAVLYRLTGYLPEAEDTYRYAIAINHNNLTSLTNLAKLLRSQQKNEEADEIESILLQKRINNPYYHAVLADEAYYQHDYLNALKHYKKALHLSNKIHEIYFGIAKVYYQMNRLSDAERALKKALSLNNAKSIEHQYIAKLNFLQAERIH